jgi:hypothetical protein
MCHNWNSYHFLASVPPSIRKERFYPRVRGIRVLVALKD